MRNLGWTLLLAALAVTGCKCGSKSAGQDAAAADAGPVAAAPLTQPVRLFRESDTAFQQGRPDEAIEIAQQVVAEQPKNALAHNLIGRSFVAKFQQSKDASHAESARVAFRKAFEVDPKFWPAMLNLAELEEQTGHPEQAAELYARVLALEPNHPDRSRFEQVIAAARTPAPK